MAATNSSWNRGSVAVSILTMSRTAAATSARSPADTSMRTAPAPEEEKEKNKGGTGVWNNPATAALIVVGAAIVLGLLIDAATDDDEGPASPSN